MDNKKDLIIERLLKATELIKQSQHNMLDVENEEKEMMELNNTLTACRIMIKKVTNNLKEQKN